MIINQLEKEYTENKILSQAFHESIWKDEAKYCLDYIYSRGISDKTISDFLVGWCPANWSGEPNWWARRIMVPLIDSNDNYVSFHTRAITSNIKDVAGNSYLIEQVSNKILREQYANGDKKEYFKPWFHGKFDKRTFLFGLNVTKNYLREKNYVIIVEGIFDALILYENGIENVVATLGTALTDYQMCVLKRYCDNLVFLFDSDNAGFQASIKSYKKSIFGADNSKIIKLPDNYDPHDFVMKFGAEKIKMNLEKIFK